MELLVLDQANGKSVKERGSGSGNPTMIMSIAGLGSGKSRHINKPRSFAGIQRKADKYTCSLKQPSIHTSDGSDKGSQLFSFSLTQHHPSFPGELHSLTAPCISFSFTAFIKASNYTFLWLCLSCPLGCKFNNGIMEGTMAGFAHNSIPSNNWNVWHICHS